MKCLFLDHFWKTLLQELHFPSDLYYQYFEKLQREENTPLLTECYSGSLVNGAIKSLHSDGPYLNEAGQLGVLVGAGQDSATKWGFYCPVWSHYPLWEMNVGTLIQNAFYQPVFLRATVFQDPSFLLINSCLGFLFFTYSVSHYLSYCII